MYPYREYFEAKVYTIWAHGPLGNSIFRQKKTQTAQRRLPIQMQAPGWSPRDNTGDDQAAGPLFQDPYTYIYIYVSYIYREREIGRKGERERESHRLLLCRCLFSAFWYVFMVVRARLWKNIPTTGIPRFTIQADIKSRA